MAVRVIGSWYYTSELPADEAATLRAAKDANHVTAEARARQYRQFRCEKLLRAVRLAGGSWEQYIGQRYELVALRALCAGERPRARWAGGLGKELFLRSLFAPDLPKELFRKVLSFWAPVWD